MTRLTLNNIAGAYASTTELNANFSLIELELDKVLYLNGTSPNVLTAALDMNSNNITNGGIANFTNLLISGVDYNVTIAAAVASATSAAATSATNSATSASASASSANAAAASATTAASEATDSASSATAAAATLVTIKAVQLSPASSDPSLDGNSNAVTTGDWYFNTSSNLARVYNGSTWQNLTPGVYSSIDDSGVGTSISIDASNNVTVSGDLNVTSLISNASGTLFINNTSPGDLIGFSTDDSGGSAKLGFSIGGATPRTVLYHNGLEKSRTISTGLDINGTVIYRPLDLGGSGTVMTVTTGMSSLDSGTTFVFRVIFANTTSTPTLNIDGFGAKTIKNSDLSALDIGAMPVRHLAELYYDGTDFILINPYQNIFYAEGVWTPTLEDSVNSPVTLSGAAGSYERIGRLVTCSTNIIATSLASATGALKLKGFPYSAAASSTNGGGYCTFYANLNITAGSTLTGTMGSGQNFLNLYEQDSAASITDFTTTKLSADGVFRMNISYRI